MSDIDECEAIDNAASFDQWQEMRALRVERDAAVARADLAEFKLRRFIPAASGRKCGSIPPCANCCRDSSGAKCTTPRKAQEAKAAEVETWAALYSRAKAAEAKLAALSLACAHCGPESAGPATDEPMACATCYGDLVLTDAAGAAILGRLYDETIGLGAPSLMSLSPECARPTGEVCIYTLAMALRGARDGSSGPLQDDTGALYRAYLTARLERWGESRSKSEGLFREFIAACLDESTP